MPNPPSFTPRAMAGSNSNAPSAGSRKCAPTSIWRRATANSRLRAQRESAHDRHHHRERRRPQRRQESGSGIRRRRPQPGPGRQHHREPALDRRRRDSRIYQAVEDARRHSIDRMIQNATVMGANAVVMMRFDSGEIAQAMNEVVAYGTAVILDPAP